MNEFQQDDTWKLYQQRVADLAEHEKQRECPRGCGCIEFFDDRGPDRVTAGEVAAGCKCPRCLGKEAAA